MSFTRGYVRRGAPSSSWTDGRSEWGDICQLCWALSIQVLGVISSLKKSMWICKKDYHKIRPFEFLAASDRTMLQQKIFLVKFLSVCFFLDSAKSKDIFRVWQYGSQVIGRLFSPSQKLKKWTQQFRQCFQLGMGILNAPRKIFWVVYEPHRELQGLQGVGFQGKNCFIKMVPNFSEINFGFTKP